MLFYEVYRLNEFFDSKIKNLTNVDYYADRLIQSDMNQLFTFLISATKDDDLEDCYEIHIWEYTGTIKICSYQFNINDYIPANVQQMIRTDLNDYNVGLVKCAHCGKKINYHEHYKQSIVAGIYCNDDWKLQYVQDQKKYESAD